MNAWRRGPLTHVPDEGPGRRFSSPGITTRDLMIFDCFRLTFERMSFSELLAIVRPLSFPLSRREMWHRTAPGSIVCGGNRIDADTSQLCKAMALGKYGARGRGIKSTIHLYNGNWKEMCYEMTKSFRSVSHL
jgi:hypothetical protein